MNKGILPVSARGLSKRFGRTDALMDLNLEVGPGEVVGFLGPNGAGKTTAIRLLLGLARPTRGRATLFGLDCWSKAAVAHRRVAFVPSEASLWPQLTGAETLHLLGRIHGSSDDRYRDQLVERFRLDSSRKVRALSKKNEQKLLLIGALMTRADLLLLDEPTSGLDPLMEQEFRACIAEASRRGQAILLSSHILSEVEAVCDRVCLLREGRLIDQGSIAQMRHLSASTVELEFDDEAPALQRFPACLSCVVPATGCGYRSAGPSVRC